MKHSPRWRKSSHSTAQSSCVEVAHLPHGRHGIRDSHHPHLPTLTFPTHEWRAFLAHVTSPDHTPAE